MIAPSRHPLRSDQDAALCGPILCMTIATPDLAQSAEACARAFGARQVAGGTIDAAMAAHWQAPALAGRAWALLSGGLRLVETAPADTAPLASLGWAAAEISVMDADAVVARACAAGFRPLGAVRQLGSTPAIRAGQIAGPEGAAFYVTDVSGYTGALDLSGATGDGACFIAVLASGDLEADRAWLETNGIGRRVTDRDVAVPVLRDTLGVPSLRLSSLQLAGGCLIEIDGYPAATPPRATALGLPAGVAMLTLRGPVEGSARPEHGGRAARVDRLPGGALLERVAA